MIKIILKYFFSVLWHFMIVAGVKWFYPWCENFCNLFFNSAYIMLHILNIRFYSIRDTRSGTCISPDHYIHCVGLILRFLIGPLLQMLTVFGKKYLDKYTNFRKINHNGDVRDCNKLKLN